jgi:hypothetical protein
VVWSRYYWKRDVKVPLDDDDLTTIKIRIYLTLQTILMILDKSFIHCPAEDKAEATIFGFKPQDEYKPGLAERDN